MTAAPRPDAPATGREAAAPEKRPDYEFSETDKESFRALAASVSFVGVCSMLFGALACVFVAGAFYSGFVASAVGTAAVGLVAVVAAWWMVSAGRALSALVRTRGRDVDDLMEAVGQLRRLFGLARVLIVVLAMAAVAGGAVVVWCTFLGERAGRCFGLFG